MIRRLAVLAPVGALVAALWTVELPYLAEGPGPARDVAPLIEVGADRYASAGHFILTSVSFAPVNAFEAIGAWLDPDRSIVSEDVLLAPGETPEQADRRAISEMDQSKIDAAHVVLRMLTEYPRDHGRGVLIERTVPGFPAEGRLFPGDVIVSVDGTPTPDRHALLRILRAARPGRVLTFRVRVQGTTEPVRMAPVLDEDLGRPVVGIVPVANFPFAVSISSGDIGGPSAGLMWALGLYDLLTPGDLTGGRTIAGTGVIGLDGSVGPIGGVQQKIVAARESGARVFLVPRENLAEARPVAGDMRLYPVASFDEALELLRA